MTMSLEIFLFPNNILDAGISIILAKLTGLKVYSSFTMYNPSAFLAVVTLAIILD